MLYDTVHSILFSIVQYSIVYFVYNIHDAGRGVGILSEIFISTIQFEVLPILGMFFLYIRVYSTMYSSLYSVQCKVCSILLNI